MQSYVPRYHRVYVVDDHDIVRRGLRDLLALARDIVVVGDSASAREAVPEILRLDADVMLLDLQLQDGTGIDVCRAVRSVSPMVSGVLLTASSDEEALASAVVAGAAGYLVKLNRTSDIVRTIRNLRPCTSLIEADSVRRVSYRLESAIASLRPPATEYELKILEGVLAGQTDSQIADALSEDDGRLGADARRIIARTTSAFTGQTKSPGEPGAGKHRRLDGPSE